MTDEQGHDAQRETPAEREAKKNPANRQDLEKPAPGRDEPPADAVKAGKRSPDSPWMGGG
jgi:hypothetical protein